MNRNERIARAIQVSGKTKSEIAKLCDVAPSAVTQWISGESKTLKAESVFALAKATGFRAEWITLGTGPERAVEAGPAHSQGELVGLVSAWDADTPLEDDEVELPYFSEVELAAGDGRIAVQEIPGRKLRFSLPALREAGVNPKKAICAKVRGNSMEPLIMDRSTIGIDQSATDVIDGEIYALEHEGMLRVKYLYRLPGGGLRLRSFNRAEHGDEEYSPKEMQSQGISIIGWVFWWSTLRSRGAFKR